MAIHRSDPCRSSFSSHDLTDELVAGSWRPNADGSITIEACVTVYGPDGTSWGEAAVTLRLKAHDPESRAWARRVRRERSAA